MSTSPYFDGSTSLVSYNVPRVGSVRPGVTSYTRERDFARATRYNNGIGYNSRGYDYPSDYELALAERRELEDIRLAEYRRNEYPGGTTIITGGARDIRGSKYLTSGRSGMGMYPQSGYGSGVRTVSLERPGAAIHRATRYTNQPVGYGLGEYVGDYPRSPLQTIHVPAGSGGRARHYSTQYHRQPGFGPSCGYESGFREQVVVVPSGRTRSSRRYL